MSQRQLAGSLGVSLGAANYCMKALVEKGWVKLENFQKNPKKLGYFYLLTPAGVTAKAHLTASFLKRKLVEYENLRSEIEELTALAQDLASDDTVRVVVLTGAGKSFCAGGDLGWMMRK